jgi:hypothetical protein
MYSRLVFLTTSRGVPGEWQKYPGRKSWQTQRGYQRVSDDAVQIVQWRLPEARYFFTTNTGMGLILILYYAYNVCGLYFRGLMGFGGPQHKFTLRGCGASLNSDAG